MRTALLAGLVSVGLLMAPPVAAGGSPFEEGSIRLLSAPGADRGEEVTALLDEAFLREAAGRETLLLQSLPFPGGARLDVSLRAFSPLAPGSTIVEMTDAGPVEHPPPQDRAYFHGTAPASEGSLAFFVIGPQTFEGFVMAEGRLAVYGIGGGGSGPRLAAASLFSPDTPHPICEADAPADQPWVPGAPPVWELPPAESSTPLTGRIAIEMDYESFASFGSVSAASAYATGLLGAVSTIYQADANTTLQAANIRVWSTPSDPYSSGSNAATLLAELKAEYIANMGSIQRGATHLLARRDGMGGLAYVDVLCNNNWAYGVEGISGTYTYPNSAYTWDAYALAHEMGHSFKSAHTHCYGTNVGLADWIDKCYASEAGCFSGGVVNPPMGEKTLMSYCHLLTPYQVTMTFKDKYTYTSGLIRQGAEAASCFTTSGCTLTCTASASPTSGNAPLTVKFTATASPSGCSGSPTYAWTFGDGGTSTLQSPSHAYASAGVYSWNLTVSVNGTTCAKSGTVTVWAPTCTLACSASAAPTSGTAPLQVQFTASATPSNCSGSVSYAWDFGDGASSTSQNPTHTFSGAGTYAWNLLVSIQGISCSAHGSVTVAAPCSLTCTGSASPSSGTAPLNVKFSGDATPSGCSGSVGYAWTFGDGATSTEQSPSHTYPNPGSFGWTLTATIQGVPCTQSGTVTVTAPPCTLACSASAAPDSGTAPLAVTFTSSATPSHCSGGVTFAWALGDGEISALQNPSHIYATAGTYLWTLAASAEGETCTQAGSVTVSAPPCTLTCGASASLSSGPLPLTVAFSASAAATNCSGGVAFAWTFGDGSTSSEQNPIHTYHAEGPYSWALTATADAEVCTQTGTVTVAPGCSLSCSASASPSSGTPPLTVTFAASAAATNCSGPPTFAWTFGDGETSTEQNPTHTFAIAGTFAWSLTAAADSGTCTKTGTVIAIPGLPGDCDGDGSVSIGEVQRAINMFLGIQSPGCGVDCNAEGTVSIGEVQKVINGFLGLPVSC